MWSTTTLVTWPLIWFNWLGYDGKTCLCQRFLYPNSKTSNLAHSRGIPKELSNPYPLRNPTWNWQATLILGSTELVRKCLLKDRGLCLHPRGPSHENWEDLMLDVKKEPTYWYNVYKYRYIYNTACKHIDRHSNHKWFNIGCSPAHEQRRVIDHWSPT